MDSSSLLPLPPSFLSVSPLPLLWLRPRFRTIPPGRPEGPKSCLYSPVTGLWKTGLCLSLFCAVTLGWVVRHEEIYLSVLVLVSGQATTAYFARLGPLAASWLEGRG